MKKILQTRNVFIDASYFRSISFDVSSHTALKFLSLCQSDELKLYTTPITIRENEHNIKKFSEELFNDIQKLRKKGRLLEIMKNECKGQSLENIKQEDIQTEIQEKINRFIAESKVKEISISNDSVTTVLDMYFNKMKPFGNKKKKSEFPDAFIFDSLSAYAKNNQTIFYVVSNDGDFSEACSQSDFAIHVDSLAKIINLYNSHQDISDWIISLVELHMDSIIDKIKNGFELLGFYADDIYGDVEDVQVTNIEVVEIYLIHLEENEAIIAVNTEIHFTADVSYDDPINGIYDSEDKVWISFGTTTKHIKESLNIDSEFKVLFEKENDIFEILETDVNSNEDIAISANPYEG